MGPRPGPGTGTRTVPLSPGPATPCSREGVGRSGARRSPQGGLPQPLAARREDREGAGHGQGEEVWGRGLRVCPWGRGRERDTEPVGSGVTERRRTRPPASWAPAGADGHSPRAPAVAPVTSGASSAAVPGVLPSHAGPLPPPRALRRHGRPARYVAGRPGGGGLPH